MSDLYTVLKGDTLSELARKFGTTVANLVNWNNITDPNFIVVGQELITDGSGSPSTSTSTSSGSRAIIKVFGLQSNTDRTMYATWDWSKSKTENYQTKWYYDTGDGVWFVGNDSTTKEKQATYSAPSNAKKVRFIVKPISQKENTNGTETYYWTASWSTEQIYDFSNNPPKVPAAPSVEIKEYNLTAKLENLDVNATHIQFQVIKNDTVNFATGQATILTTNATYTCKVEAGGNYKVRCRSYRDGIYSEWSTYSSTAGTAPAAPSGFTELRATSETSVYFEWEAVSNAETYDIEYAIKKEYFDGSDNTTTTSQIKTLHFEKTGLESGQEYFFRIRAVNEHGESPWSDIKSISIGKDPAAPTTWSSTTTVVTGEPLNLYWVHNSEDESSQTYAELELYINDVKDVFTIKNSTDEEEKDKTSVYSINTSGYIEGTKIRWRVRTSGVTGVYGDWSIERTVDVYAPPVLTLNATDIDGNMIDILTAFPIKVSAVAGPNTQAPTAYHLTVSAKESYETVDVMGNTKMVIKGEDIYSEFFDISEELNITLSAGDLDLENNIEYTLTCLVSMNSGLTAESSVDFKVAWGDEVIEPTAEIGIDKSNLSAYIRPYCEKLDTTLSVYRREYDGSFVEIASGLENSAEAFVTDPHPALDYARYRVVALANDTGAISYYDVPGFYVGEKSVVIQWDETWTNFDTTNEDALAAPAWSGSMLKLPYNIDVSDSNNIDVALIEYAGRKHPVSYYGTQVGQTSTWNVVIPKSDTETIYNLRRLAKWMGDVYVREPSGSGYWASISVSFNLKHKDVTVPVTFNITRVEGGI